MASFFTDNYIKLDSATSTNNFAYNLLKSGKIKEGTVVTALHQSKGQGQMGLKWESEHGKNILMSIVLSPDILLKNQFHLNICISLALHDFAKKYFKKEPKIKWPNDLLVDRKKLAGILIKNIVKSSTIKDAIVGIGLNVNQIKFKKYSLQATSMKKLLNKEFDIEELQKELLDCIELRYLQLKRKEFVKIHEEYVAVLYDFNQWRYYEIEGGKIKAKITGIDEIGMLLLEMENGKTKAFALKEISFLF